MGSTESKQNKKVFLTKILEKVGNSQKIVKF